LKWYDSALPRTIKGTKRCLLLQLRQNARGRFIVFLLLGSIGRSRTIIFPEGSLAEGWFAVTKLLKESQIFGKGEASFKQWKRPEASKPRVGRSQSYVEAIRGRVSDPQRSYLRGWRYKQCGSWDVFPAVMGQEKDSVLGGNEQQIGAEFVRSRGKGSTVEVENRTSSPSSNDGQNKLSLESNVCANQFQALRDLLGDFPSDIVVPESTFESGVEDHAQRSPSLVKNDCIVYSRRREKGKEKVINDFGSGSLSLLGCGGVNAEVKAPLGQD